jgi:hypothetical protein
MMITLLLQVGKIVMHTNVMIIVYNFLVVRFYIEIVLSLSYKRNCKIGDKCMSFVCVKYYWNLEIKCRVLAL